MFDRCGESQCTLNRSEAFEMTEESLSDLVTVRGCQSCDAVIRSGLDENVRIDCGSIFAEL